MNQPVILCGLGRIGWVVFDYLRKAGLNVVAVDLSVSPTDPRLAGARFIQGDCRHKDVLLQAGLAQARGVIILTSDDLVNISATLMIRSVQPDVRMVVRMFNENLLPRLGKAVGNVVALSISAMTAPVLALTALTGEGLGTFRVGDDLRQVAEVAVDERTRLEGAAIADVGSRYRVLMVAHRPVGGPERFLLDIDPDARLMSGDRLVVCGAPEDLAPLRPAGDEGALTDLRWAGRIRVAGRISARTLSEIELPVKVATGVLVVVLLIGMLVYKFGMNRSLAHGLFRTISLAATGADMHEDELDPQQEWQKVFVSLMRLMGAALIATFTAIVTNYLLRARLAPALEMRRIPDGGHLVVCGLGDVGYRVVEELLERAEQVVVIERNKDNRFIAPMRRKGVAVIVDDAAALEVLRHVHAATARAVIAATDNWLANLEIALLVRELNPKQRVVIRLGDPFLAQVLREAANIRLALSTSALAAPAFVAALFGDRVSNLFLVAGRVLALIELAVPAGDPCLDGQAVRALSIDYRILPVGLHTADGSVQEQIPSHRLAPGDTLTGILALPDLARLLRRERVAADWSVEVTAAAAPARGWLTQLLRTQRQLAAEEAEQAVQILPFCLGERLTRGQAEDLLARCRRERVTAQLRQTGGNNEPQMNADKHR